MPLDNPTLLAQRKAAAKPDCAPRTCYVHPTTIQEFESVYRAEYTMELESCDRWIRWCEKQGDTHGMNFHQGMRAAHVFNNIKTEQLLRVLKQESPNAASGHNEKADLPPTEARQPRSGTEGAIGG